MNYEDLTEDEKAAITVALSPNSARATLAEIFGNRLSSSGLYSKMRKGQESLQMKGLVSQENAYQLTDLGYSIVPNNLLAKTIRQLKANLSQRNNELTNADNAKRILEKAIEHKTAEKEQFEQLAQKYALTGNIIKTFDFLQIDENWASVILCSALLEHAAKNKLEKLGCPSQELVQIRFDDLLKKLNEFLIQKENRYYTEGSLFDPKSLHDIRNRLIHQGYKTKINKSEAEAFFTMTKSLVERINGST